MASASDRQAVRATRKKQAGGADACSPESNMSPGTDSLTKPVVLITGAAGRIGTALIEHFAPFYTIVGMDIKERPEESSAHEWIQCDLTSDESVSAAMAIVSSIKPDGPGEPLRIAAVVHLAAYYDFSGEPSDMYDNLTVRGTRRLLEHLKPLPVEQFIFTSSLLVMKPDDEHKLNEWNEVSAKWDYPQSKVAAERVIHEHCPFPHVILRIAGVYDEGCHSIPLSQQIARINEKRMTSFVFPGNTGHGQAMIHMDDLVTCIQCVVGARDQLPQSETLLVAEPETMSYADLQEELGTMIHASHWPTLRVPKALAKVGAWLQEHMTSDEDSPFIRPWMVDLADDHYEVDLTRARTQLSWEPVRRLRHTLPKMLGRFHKNKEAWYEEHDLKHPESVEFTHVKGTGMQATPF
ncbi:MAG: nucleoside-diphosphate-sugar epimerase [Planctomycetaceae bacterium]|jgi:nucleoside-diphosphate-sugar epimerase